jgi:hypothetical protein
MRRCLAHKKDSFKIFESLEDICYDEKIKHKLILYTKTIGMILPCVIPSQLLLTTA